MKWRAAALAVAVGVVVVACKAAGSQEQGRGQGQGNKRDAQAAVILTSDKDGHCLATVVGNDPRSHARISASAGGKITWLVLNLCGDGPHMVGVGSWTPSSPLASDPKPCNAAMGDHPCSLDGTVDANAPNYSWYEYVVMIDGSRALDPDIIIEN
jgi:hypothetical protein